MTTFYWPCRVARDGNGQHRVSPLYMKGCDGSGSSLEEAIEATRAALVDHLKARTGEIVLPAMVAFDAAELQSREVLRIEIDLT